MFTTSVAEHSFNRNVEFLGQCLNLAHCVLVFMGQKEMAVEAVYTAEGGHLKIIHQSGLLFLGFETSTNRHMFYFISYERILQLGDIGKS